MSGRETIAFDAVAAQAAGYEELRRLVVLAIVKAPQRGADTNRCLRVARRIERELDRERRAQAADAWRWALLDDAPEPYPNPTPRTYDKTFTAVARMYVDTHKRNYQWTPSRRTRARTNLRTGSAT